MPLPQALSDALIDLDSSGTEHAVDAANRVLTDERVTLRSVSFDGDHANLHVALRRYVRCRHIGLLYRLEGSMQKAIRVELEGEAIYSALPEGGRW